MYSESTCCYLHAPHVCYWTCHTCHTCHITPCCATCTPRAEDVMGAWMRHALVGSMCFIWRVRFCLWRQMRCRRLGRSTLCRQCTVSHQCCSKGVYRFDMLVIESAKPNPYPCLCLWRRPPRVFRCFVRESLALLEQPSTRTIETNDTPGICQSSSVNSHCIIISLAQHRQLSHLHIFLHIYTSSPSHSSHVCPHNLQPQHSPRQLRRPQQQQQQPC